MNSATGTANDISKALLSRIATGGFLAAALHTVIELGIPDQVADGRSSTRDLAEASHADEDVIYRVLRALASVGLFNEETPRTFSLTRPAHLLRTGHSTIADQLRWMAHPAQLRAASRLLDVALPSRTYDLPALFEVLALDEDLSGCFHRAMAASTGDVAAAVLDSYDFTDASVVVDVGGGRGQLLCPILKRHRHIRGVLFDRPEIQRDAEAHLLSAQLSERCALVTGDFFQSIPSGGDTYLLKHVLHDWDDTKVLRLLALVREQLADRPTAKVLIIESPVSAGNRPDSAKIGDLAMLLTVGGRERTLSEYEILCAGAGLRLERIMPTSAGISILQAIAIA